jgi:hypothetical protein
MLALMLSAHLCAGQYVELTAKIETVSWNREGASRMEPWEVRCVVGTNTWQMEGLFLQGAKSTSWFKGTNLVQIHELSNPVGENQRLLDYTDGPDRHIQVATPSGQRWETISVSVDGNPSRPVRQRDLLTLHGRIAWLAFCSGPCLKREGRRLYPPSDFWKQVVSAPAGFSDRTVVFEDGLGLPKSMHLQATNGFPVLQYGVSSSTNVCGWEFPQEFYLAQYQPALSSYSNRFGPRGWEIDFIAKGTVIAIGPGLKPEIPSVAQK